MLGALWSAMLLALLALVRTLAWTPPANAVLIALFGPPLGQPGGQLVVHTGLLAASVAVASAVGAGMGGIAAGLGGTGLRRSGLLLILSIPALYLFVYVMFVGSTASEVARAGLDQLVALPFMAVFGAVVGVVNVLPFVALPLVLAALVLEGWTRAPSAPPGGMSRPAVRATSIGLVAAAGLGMAALAAARWPAP